MEGKILYLAYYKTAENSPFYNGLTLVGFVKARIDGNIAVFHILRREGLKIDQKAFETIILKYAIR